MPCTLCQHQWSTSRPLLPCTRHLHLWRSSSRPLMPCTLHLRLLWRSSSRPAPAVYAAPAPSVEYIAFAPAVYAAPAPVVELLPVPAVVQAPTPAVEYIAPLPVVFQAPTSAVENVAPVPAVVQAPTSAVENIAPVPAVVQAPTPVVKSFSHVPAVSRSPAPGQSSTSRRGHDLPLPSGWRCAEDASGRVYYWHVHTRQTRWTPPVSVDVDEDVEDEEVEDDGMDEIYAESRFPAGFLPMRMCRWFPLRELPAGMGVYVRSLGERAAPPSSWSRALTLYGLLYLTVTCSCWSCLRCTG